jgi:hypothetical protein
MRLSLRDLLVIRPPLPAKKERQVQAINQTNHSFSSFVELGGTGNKIVETGIPEPTTGPI